MLPPCAPTAVALLSARGPPEVSGGPQRCPSEPCQRETSGTSLGTLLLCPEGPPAEDMTATRTRTFIAHSPSTRAGTAPSTSFLFAHLCLKTTLRGRGYYSSYFVDEERKDEFSSPKVAGVCLTLFMDTKT